MRDAFASYLQDKPGIKAIFVGTRRTDPHGEHLGFFDETDRGWPPFMRVHPVIDWHYAEIWAVGSPYLMQTVVAQLGTEQDSQRTL